MASASWRSDWVREKCAVAAALARGEAGGSYSESIILVCAILSALSAEVWPGRRIDRKRFIELLVRTGPSTITFTSISTPLLAQHLIRIGDQTNSRALANSQFSFSATRVITGPEVDLPESNIKTLCPSLDNKTIRQFSYACLLYEDVRSSYAHEYRHGNRAESRPMAHYQGQAVSYVNRLLGPMSSDTGRFIHFHVERLIETTAEIATQIDAISSAIPHSIPSSWWIDGAP